ncbi:hypothetical protein E3N88_12054 [Mikania micrantha]|uniref:Uncharacterized protein n=1 Tax=Mikania micrantha TaxID=192012 RepID=A0A5N6P7E1_9ASTR|nr:hypothetical protein E3N88_12054 [Mikania micrantha]
MLARARSWYIEAVVGCRLGWQLADPTYALYISYLWYIGKVSMCRFGGGNLLKHCTSCEEYTNNVNCGMLTVCMVTDITNNLRGSVGESATNNSNTSDTEKLLLTFSSSSMILKPPKYACIEGTTSLLHRLYSIEDIQGHS